MFNRFNTGKNKGFYLLCRIFALFKTIAKLFNFYKYIAGLAIKD